MIHKYPASKEMLTEEWKAKYLIVMWNTSVENCTDVLPESQNSLQLLGDIRVKNTCFRAVRYGGVIHVMPPLTHFLQVIIQHCSTQYRYLNPVTKIQGVRARGIRKYMLLF